MDQVTLLLEVDKAKFKEEHLVGLRKEFIHKFGENTELIIKCVDEIPREKSGKFRMIKNTMEGN